MQPMTSKKIDDDLKLNGRIERDGWVAQARDRSRPPEAEALVVAAGGGDGPCFAERQPGRSGARGVYERSVLPALPDPRRGNEMATSPQPW